MIGQRRRERRERQRRQQERLRMWTDIALALEVTHARPMPDSPYLEGNNEAVETIQAYLHGQALAELDDPQKRTWLLELRRDIDKFKHHPDPDDEDQETARD